MNVLSILALGVFFVAYFFIIQEKVHKTIVVLLATALLAVFRVYTLGGEEGEKSGQLSTLLDFVDFNVLGLIIGMMIIVRLTEESGVFTHVAMKIVQYARGNMKLIFFSLMMLTAIMTAFLSNVTTVMILTPIFLVICYRFKINPLPFLITEILLSNIGGTATPIGDMTNIIIASRAGFSFAKVVAHLGPIVFLIAIVIAGIATMIFRKGLISPHHDSIKDLENETWITDKTRMVQGLSIIVVVIAGFIFHDLLQMENGMIALTGAMFFLLITKKEPKQGFALVEWSIIFFFIGLFTLIGALEITGIIDIIAQELVSVFGQNIMYLVLALVFGAAVFSAFVDNIPLATAMIPIIFKIGQSTGMPTDPLFWALALGACIGGGGTLVGASCNLVVAGIAEQNEIPLTFRNYFKFAFPMMMVAVVISAGYLLVFQTPV